MTSRLARLKIPSLPRQESIDEYSASRRLGSQGRNAGPGAQFLLRQEVPYGIALVRIMITFTLLFVMVPRWYFARELFSTDGAPISLWDAYSTHPWVPNPNGRGRRGRGDRDRILTLLTSMFGWCTRFSLIVATSGYLYLTMYDIIGTMNKYTVDFRAIDAPVMFFAMRSRLVGG